MIAAHKIRVSQVAHVVTASIPLITRGQNYSLATVDPSLIRQARIRMVVGLAILYFEDLTFAYTFCLCSGGTVWGTGCFRTFLS